MFENSVPGLPEAAAKEGLKALEYMRKYGAYEVTTDVYRQNEKALAIAALAGSKVEANDVVTKDGKTIGVMVDGKPVVGYNTPSRKLELFSKTMADWKWPEFARACCSQPQACHPPLRLRSEEHTSELQSHLNLVF